jgi:hypothetical protein
MGMVGGGVGGNDGTMCAWAGRLTDEGLRENTQRGTGREPPGETFAWWLIVAAAPAPGQCTGGQVGQGDKRIACQ